MYSNALSLQSATNFTRILHLSFLSTKEFIDLPSASSSSPYSFLAAVIAQLCEARLPRPLTPRPLPPEPRALDLPRAAAPKELHGRYSPAESGRFCRFSGTLSRRSSSLFRPSQSLAPCPGYSIISWFIA